MQTIEEWLSQQNRLLLGLLTNAILFGVWAMSHFKYVGKVDFWESQIEQQNEIIVFGTQMTSLYFAWVGLLPGIVILNLHLLFKDILKQGPPRMVLKLQNFLAGIMFLGVFLLTAGNLFINPIWEARFQDAGFVECENRVLNIRKALFNDVWVRNPAHCEDPMLRYILHEHFGDEGFEEASQYLSALDDQTEDPQ